MTILFVCKWNQGRSQIAEALFRKYTFKHTVFSAGTHANELPGVILKICAPLVVKVLKEWDIDISQKTSKKLTQNMVNKADKVIVLSKRNDLPDYLIDSNKVIYWNIDEPKSPGYNFLVPIRNLIDRHVKDLIPTLD